MKSLPILLVPALALAFAAFVPPGDEPRFAVESKTTLTKHFDLEDKMTSQSFKITVDGNEIPAEMLGELELSLESTSSYVVTDEYVKMGKGRPDKLKRTFDTLEDKSSTAFKGQGAEKNESKEKKSEFLGKSVLFTWNEESKEFKKTMAEGEGDAEKLAKLVEDCDLRGFLPGKAVAAEDSWDIEAKVLSVLMAPVGDVGFVDDEKKDKKTHDADASAQMADNMTGKAKCTYKGLREEGGQKYGVIEIKAEVATKADVDAEEEGKMALKVDLEITGEILWDMTANHAHSASITGTHKTHMNGERTMDMGGQEHHMQQEIEMAGDITFKAKFD